MAEQKWFKKKMNLGEPEDVWPGFITCDLSPKANISHDATKPFPDNVFDYDFVWSERMYEHLTPENCRESFFHVARILKPGGILRLCLPICFYGTSSINMLRDGNAEKNKWFGACNLVYLSGFRSDHSGVFWRKSSFKYLLHLG